VESELSRCHTSKWLPGDKTNEIRNGPHRATFAAAQAAKVFLTRNVVRSHELGWGARQAYLLHRAAAEEGYWDAERTRMERHQKQLPKALKTAK
jgi:hypothetical protein